MFMASIPVRQVEGAGVQHLLKPLVKGKKPFKTTDTGHFSSLPPWLNTKYRKV